MYKKKPKTLRGFRFFCIMARIVSVLRFLRAEEVCSPACERFLRAEEVCSSACERFSRAEELCSSTCERFSRAEEICSSACKTQKRQKTSEHNIRRLSESIYNSIFRAYLQQYGLRGEAQRRIVPGLCPARGVSVLRSRWQCRRRR